MSDIPVSLNTSASQRMEHAIGSIERSKFRIYESLSERIKTYKNWPKNQVTDPSDLAAAGFFYIGIEDIVKCFYCGGELKKWEKHDNPRIEHKRFFPLCGFLQPTNTQDICSKREDQKAEACKQLKNISRASRTDIKHGEVEIHDTDQPDLPQPNLIDRNSKDILPAVTVNYAMEYLQEIESEREQLRRENERLKDTVACKICLDCDVRVVFLPCGHLVACERCAERFQNCPICRKNILKKIKVHFYP